MPRTTLVPVLTAVLALAAPAAASAAPSWSAPSSLAPAPASGLAAAPAQAFVSGAGRSLVVSSDGTAPWLAGGDRAGHFDARTALGTASDGAVNTDADLGADGTLAVAWASGGAAHVTVVPAGSAAASSGRPARSRDERCRRRGRPGRVDHDGLPHEGRHDLRRERRQCSRRAARSARPSRSTAAPPGIDSPEIAVGNGGAVAVTYRKIITRYRARVAVRPAGAAAFDPPQTVSDGDQAAVSVRVAFDADGSVVAAWANGTAAQYAVRAAAATAFAAPVTLGDGAYSIELVPTPQGGTAAAWAGNGVIHAAIQAPGAAFGAAGNRRLVHHADRLRPRDRGRAQRLDQRRLRRSRRRRDARRRHRRREHRHRLRQRPSRPTRSRSPPAPTARSPSGVTRRAGRRSRRAATRRRPAAPDEAGRARQDQAEGDVRHQVADAQGDVEDHEDHVQAEVQRGLLAERDRRPADQAREEDRARPDEALHVEDRRRPARRP